MSLVSKQLGDVLTLKRGYDLPSQKRIAGDIPIVSSSGITGFHHEAKIKGPAVVTGRYGTLGQVFYVEKDCWPLNTALYVKDFKENRPRYIYYFLKNHLRGTVGGKAAVPGVNRNDLHAKVVKFNESENEQKQIESILDPYDDLIENNQRRIQLLEESARLLYREWFVHLRFPEHKHTKIINGIPEGWEKKSIFDVFLMSGISNMGKTYQKQKYQRQENTRYMGLIQLLATSKIKTSMILCVWSHVEGMEVGMSEEHSENHL